MGRLVQVRRHNPDDRNNPDKSLLSIDYEYDRVGNIRDTKVVVNYPGHQKTSQEDYYTYDENNRVLISKGRLQNGEIAVTAGQGSHMEYDSAGNITMAEKYENGALQKYQYGYTKDNQLELVRKNGFDFQTKVYDWGGNVIKEKRYNDRGRVTQINNMHYSNGLLRHMVTTDPEERETSKSEYLYDAMDLPREFTTIAVSEGRHMQTQRHRYAYELWDNYQQLYDHSVLEITDYGITYATSKRSYDVNGQLESAVDAQVNPLAPNHTVYYTTSGVDGIRSKKDSNGQTSYLTVAGKTIGDLRLDNNKATHLEVYGGFTPSGTPAQSNPMLPSIWQQKSVLKCPVLSDFQNESSGIETTLPEVPQESLGTYNLQTGDTLESIALQVYGDASLWYLIADANGITNLKACAGESGSQLHVGQRLNIPPASGSQHHSNATHKVMNASEMIGDTSATTPLPPAPPMATKNSNKSPWRIMAMVAVAIVATVATVMSAGALGALLTTGNIFGAGGGLTGLITNGLSVLGGSCATLGVAGSVGAGFAAGFIGSIAGQTAAAAFQLQQGIDLKSALLTGLATAATAGVGKLLNTNPAYQKMLGKLDEHQRVSSS